VRAYIDAGVDGIAITDHNSHIGIDQARGALEELRRDNPELPEFVIFPGVEITASGGTHILGIFDPARDAEVVNQVLVLCEYKGTRGHSDETANKTVADVASIIQGHRGICIPAHADKPRGVFSMDPREYTALATSGSIAAVEVVDDAEVSTADRLGWVSVLGSDAHHLTTDGCPAEQEAKAPGTHVTLVKAETLDLEGIRLALTDAAESVRRCRRGYSDPNSVSADAAADDCDACRPRITHGGTGRRATTQWRDERREFRSCSNSRRRAGGAELNAPERRVDAWSDDAWSA